MLAAVAFCPAAPVVVTPLAQGAAAELDALRAACRTALQRVARAGRRLVLVGPGPESRAYPAAVRGSFAGLGLPLEVGLDGAGGPLALPTSLAVGAWLLQDALGPDVAASAFALADPADPALAGWDGGPDEDVAAVVLGEGSARRTVKAPGYLDARAEPFDAAVAEALAGGDPDGLRGFTDPGADLLATGAPVWDLAGRALAGQRWAADLLYADAPYGVGYVVAAWTRR